MTMQLLDASTRLAEPRCPKILIVGPTAIGKTSLLKTLSPELLSTTLLVDLEAGDLPVADLPITSIRPRTWEDCRNIACVLGGPDPARAPAWPYSQNHYETVTADSALSSLQQYDMIFVDSYTELARRCLTWGVQQPEAFTAYGKKDLRAAYGLVGRELIAWTQQLQHTRSRTIVLVAILEKVVDDHGIPTWQIQLEGQRTRRELPAILDVIAAMVWVPFKDKPRRAFVCQSDMYPVKDRSGRLAPIEEPSLGKLLSKLSTRGD
jgi:AAA domain-containing protein